MRLFFVLIALSLASPIQANDGLSVRWIERCIDAAENSSRIAKSRGDCALDAISLCEFMDGPEVCWNELSNWGTTKAKEIILLLPERVAGSTLYEEQREKLISEGGPKYCDPAWSEATCNAANALMRYQIALVLLTLSKRLDGGND